MSIGDWESKEFPRKFDPTKSVQTRDGRKAEIIGKWEGHRAWHEVGIEFEKLMVCVKVEPKRWKLRTYHPDGRFFIFADEELYNTPFTGDDLVNIPTKIRKEGWVNIHRMAYDSFDSQTHLARQSGVYKTRIAADKACLKAHENGVPLPVATVKIEWEEEQ